MDKIKRIMNYLDAHDLYPDLPVIDGPVGTEVTIDGKQVTMFASNNYLGLATHPRLVAAAKEALDTYGIGSDGSRLLSGNLRVHREFEQALAAFKGTEDAIVWPSGYSANLGVIPAFVKPIKLGPQDFLTRKTVVISDQLNHASIIDGAILGRAKKVKYNHVDMVDLERCLRRYRRRRVLVVTDGVFSMDGDIAPLPDIVKLCKKYGATSMIDDAHGTGVLGKTGRGTLEHFGLRPVKDVDIVLGTCSKALACTGGYVAGPTEFIQFLRVASRSYMFSTAMTPAASASLIEALNVIKEEPELREKLKANTTRLRNGLHEIGFHTCNSTTQIIPILIGKDTDAIQFTRLLHEEGYYAPAVRWPAVAKNRARLRLTVMATHTNEHIDGLLDACTRVLAKLAITLPQKTE